ncbi:MAG: cytochrome c biogenesis CcdA family protein [Actinopolymorphaceae bacterium]
MPEPPFALALAAGMLAAINPCGFALLPAYLSLLVIGDDSPGRTAAVGRAIGLTLAMTAGFAAVFGLFGLVVAPVAGSIQRHLPWFTVGLGGLLVACGAWLVAGRTLPSFTVRRGNVSGTGTGRAPRGPVVTRSVPSMVGFGASYAIASIGCTIGPFLAIVVSSFRAGSVVSGVGLFAAYAAGMGMTVGVAAVAVAVARTSLLRHVRRAGASAHRIVGGLLILVGAYVAYYGWYELRILRRGVVADPLVSATENLQRWASAGLDRLGATTVAATLGLLLLLVVVIPAITRRRTRRTLR